MTNFDKRLRTVRVYVDRTRYLLNGPRPLWMEAFVDAFEELERARELVRFRSNGEWTGEARRRRWLVGAVRGNLRAAFKLGVRGDAAAAIPLKRAATLIINQTGREGSWATPVVCDEEDEY